MLKIPENKGFSRHYLLIDDRRYPPITQPFWVTNWVTSPQTRVRSSVTQMPLTDLKIRKAKQKDKAYRLSDGLGLHLQVQKNGSKL